MKYLSEYRDPELVKEFIDEIHAITTKPWTLMEICGGQTHSLVRNGILEMLPDKITMVHGPGCPVCVTSVSIIDEAVFLSEQPDTILCSFGDMLRVPGSKKSLLEAKAAGADIRILYSPLEAVQIALNNPDKQVVFFAVGFETTAPANALSVVQADKMGLNNFSILASHVLVPPAMEAILSDKENKIDAFLAAGHVCTIMGIGEYFPVAAKYQCPIVVTGFEPVDLLQGILMAVKQLEKGEFTVENQYARNVKREGNQMAQDTIHEVFGISDRIWRGIGNIPQSGYEVNDRYKKFNARVKFNIDIPLAEENKECISGDIMKGLKKPKQCPNFGIKCKPEHPLGAPMVSSEGACAAYYQYANTDSIWHNFTEMICKPTKKIFFFAFLLLVSSSLFAQKLIKGTIVEAATNSPLEGATITLIPGNNSAITNIRGKFILHNVNITDSLHISSVGFQTKIIPISIFNEDTPIRLELQNILLENITVNTKVGDEYKTISKTDIKMRGLNNSQEVLRMIPGLFIGQHQGGGKAEQIFVRGFDCDHGTDINITTDGMPVNMVSHAHGQGYADMHFIIPETIEEVDFQKGPYNPAKGNFTTSGFVDVKTKNAIPSNIVKLEGGMFDTYRALGILNLLNEKAKQRQESWYIASEFAYSNGYFDHPQDFKRFNFFTKYNAKLSANTFLIVSASAFSSKWNASGQIPSRAVADGMIGFYGAIDSTEGGQTARNNLNAQLITTLQDGSFFKNQIYYSNYQFDLHTNFTFFLIDSINGDQIRQRESRNLFGYNGSYHRTSHIGTVQFISEMGVGLRWDLIKNIELSHTKDRYILLNRLAFGDISELNASGYLSETIQFSSRFSMKAGLRFDQFMNQYTDHLRSDSVFKAASPILSPKINFNFQQSANTQFYLNLGKGFHSNDTRVCVTENGHKVLPAAYSADVGTIYKPSKNLLIHAAVWYLYLDQEFVYNGDDGTPQPAGKTQRTGIDFSGRYEPFSSIYIDLDINYAHGRFIDEIKGQDFIPLAPVWSSTGGITYKNKTGMNGSLRYRWLGNRPANESYSLSAAGYFVNDFVLNYTQKKYEIGLTVNNIFSVKWKETQFETLSRLKNEATPVDEINFTPGTKLAAKLSLCVFF